MEMCYYEAVSKAVLGSVNRAINVFGNSSTARPVKFYNLIMKFTPVKNVAS